MHDPPRRLIEDIAKAHKITLEDNMPIECRFFVYAHVFKQSDQTLKSKEISDDEIEEIAISKVSIIEIYNAFIDIFDYFMLLKSNNGMRDEIEADVENSRPHLRKAISHLQTSIKIYNDTRPSLKAGRENPESMKLRISAVESLADKLLECRECIADINSQMGKWCKKEKMIECQKQKTASPTPPTSLAKERKNRGKRPA